jgi:hypothetical protein
MQLTADVKTKIGTLTSVEQVLTFCAILLQDTYQNIRVVEGLDATNAEVQVPAISVDLLPVVRASGSKEFRIVSRASFGISASAFWRAAKWNIQTDLGSDPPNASIVNIANNI